MAREKYNAQKEHEIIGMYPSIKGMQIGGTADGGMSFVPESPRFYRPIDVRENYKMLFRGETPYWIPESGWFFCNVNEFRPRQQADNLANHQGIDGGDFIDWAKQGKVVKGWFDIPLEWEEASMGASVRPGHPMITDMNDWKTLNFPNLDDIDFEAVRKMNKEYLSSDKANQLGIQFGFWERMMNLMDVVNAAMALLDEDQEDAIHEFLDALADLYIDYIDRLSQVCRIDSIMLHDDWGTHNGPFFSLDTAMEFFVPPMKKVVDFCHSKDIIFEHHCCGCAQKLVPAMEACGTDYWFPQASINNLDEMIEKHKNDHITFSVSSPMLPKGSTVEEVREIARKWVDKYKDKGILLCQDVNLTADPNYDPGLYPIFSDAVYEFSRIAYQDVED